MKINKKILLCMALAPVTLLASCGGGGDTSSESSSVDPYAALAGTYDIKMWVSEVAGVKESFESQVAAFCEAHEGIVINATIEGVTEADSATSMLTDVSAGADIFCFAQDQFARCVQGGALSKLGEAAAKFVKESNIEGAVKAATSGESIYAYPLTADNGYFMFYDKREITDESHLDDLEALIKDCEDAGKKFAFEMDTSAWYNASFFFGAGCHSEWTTDDKGKFTSVSDDFNSDKGLIAMRGMQRLVKSTSHISESGASVFSAATPAAILVSGTWAYNGVKEAIGEENIGFAKLPHFTVDGESYQLGSYSGNKLLGVKPQTDVKRSAVLNLLAQYLTGEECQKQRVEQFSWGPSNKAVLELPVVKDNEMLSALAAQNAFATPQGQIHGSWWDIAKVLSTDAKDAALDDETALKAALQKYQDALDSIFSMSDDEKRAFTVIGSFDTAPSEDFTAWGTDLPMTESPEGTWTSAALTLTEGDAFKVRQGKSWDVAYGKDGQDYVVSAEEAGTKKIQLVVTSTGGTVSIID